MKHFIYLSQGLYIYMIYVKSRKIEHLIMLFVVVPNGVFNVMRHETLSDSEEGHPLLVVF